MGKDPKGDEKKELVSNPSRKGFAGKVARFWTAFTEGVKKFRNPKADKRTRPIIAMLGVVTLGLICLAYSIPGKKDDFGALLFAGGALVVGAALGFVFGIPKTLQGTAPGEVLSHRVNTNLEEISDWLTKIIVGLGLTQLIRIPELIADLGDYQESVFGETDAAAPLAGTAAVYFAVCGFLMGYLGTRLFLQEAIAASDRTLALKEAEQAKDLSQGSIETSMWMSLYQKNGYKEVIELGKRYEDVMKNRPYFWVRLAAAYGQLAKEEPARYREAKGLALAAARRAIELEPEVRDDLAQIWDPGHPDKEDGENDLEVFKDENDFRALLDVS